MEIFKSDATGNILEKPIIARVAFRRIYDGMEILTDYQDNAFDLVKTIWYIESRFEVVFPGSMYFTYALHISKNANKKIILSFLISIILCWMNIVVPMIV